MIFGEKKNSLEKGLFLYVMLQKNFSEFYETLLTSYFNLYTI